MTEADCEGAPERALASAGRSERGGEEFSAEAGFEDLGWARPDIAREARLGLPELVYGPGKSAEQISGVVRSLLTANSGPVLVTRVDAGTASTVLARVGESGPWGPGDHDERARLLWWRPAAALGFRVAIVSAGTSDGPVAAEAVAVASCVGLTVESIADVGVAGIHRVLAQRDRLAEADAVICVAGMDGALPSVVGGLVGCPVIAVPTSVGYGATFEGLAPLLAMLSSCSAGMVVVNIDSGFGAAIAAYRIARAVCRR